MTVVEFFGCSFLAFGPPVAMFALTIAHDPIRIIILIAASFFWLVSLLLSSTVWLAFHPVTSKVTFGLICSVFIQEGFRYLMYKVLRKTESGLQEVTDIVRIADYRHILSYASGLGFGIISGAFSLVNILADSVGPATVGLKAASDIFMLISAAQSLAMILLHTFWSVIFFNACDVKNYYHIGYVVASHLFVSCMTLLNASGLYAVTLLISYTMVCITGAIAFQVAGGTVASFRKFLTCK
ncbi:gamma-secretase subunit Aph-1 [Anopheles arabiensis]|uniref:AGAP009816-PA n=5 Tax=gambiae species complex TaxID=44542 RepID=Q7PM79_ANOGA|nr:gamma-secretase subunit Aph-1 [Anopheles arabiensis]XP_040232116.1 gamma-secretase subunit Aph-1 [Anopheles coluzzii]XP_318923.2 gamma-secretase subunit Aph-1 [Anopheles gambiae]EAA14158.3 AGAP009816-PA [Anopheles gambiae str. PEST]